MDSLVIAKSSLSEPDLKLTYCLSGYLVQNQKISQNNFNTSGKDRWWIFLFPFGRFAIIYPETGLIPEINNGQLIRIIRDVYFVDAKGYNKIMGIPITKTELLMKLEEMMGGKN